MIITTRKLSGAQESIVAKAVKGKKVANSGATLFEKGDVKSEFCLIECKTQAEEKQSFSIKKEWINILKREWLGTKKRMWSLVFNFGGYKNSENFYIISEKAFLDLQEYYKQEESAND